MEGQNVGFIDFRFPGFGRLSMECHECSKEPELEIRSNNK